MKRIVIVAGVYYPQPSPTGKCVKQYADILKENFDVSIVFIQSDLKRIDAKKIDETTLYALFNTRLYLENWFIDKAKTARFVAFNKIFHVLTLLTKTLGRIQSLLVWPNNMRWFYKSALKKLYQLNDDKKIDYLITVCSPFPAHMAGRKFKQEFPDTKWITYTVDPFSQNNKKKHIGTLLLQRNNRRIKEEIDINNLADFNFVSEEFYNNGNQILDNVYHKTKILPYLIQKQPKAVEHKSYFPEDKINLLYAGKFYRNIRNPEYLFKVFLEMNNDNILLHLYSSSDCEDIIEYYVNKSKGRIIRHKLVTVEEIREIMTSADILVNISNNIKEYKPSKVFEYISIGRPILSFYENGLIDQTLDKYPISLQIEKSDTNLFEDSRKMLIFCENNKNMCVIWDDIEGIYSKNSYRTVRNTLLSVIK